MNRRSLSAVLSIALIVPWSTHGHELISSGRSFHARPPVMIRARPSPSGGSTSPWGALFGPTPAAMGASCSSGAVHDLIVAQPWDDSYALYVADRESHCQPGAYNSTEWWEPGCHASGVFQILTQSEGLGDCIWEYWAPRCGYAGASVFDYVANIEVAACMVAEEGWGPWAL